MKPAITRSSHPLSKALLGGLLMATLSASAVAGDNDPVGDLPFSEGNKSGSNQNQSSEDGSGEEQELTGSSLNELSDPRAGALVMAGSPSSVSSTGQAFAATIDPSAPAELLLPELAVANGHAFLVLDMAEGASLVDLLGGQYPVLDILSTPVSPQFDLKRFAELVAEHLGAGFRVTWIVVDTDEFGVTHVTAARVAADGSPTEVVIH